MRRQFTAEQKASVALAALKGDKTINQIASEFEVNPTQVKLWRNAAKASMADAFADKRKASAKAADTQKRIDELPVNIICVSGPLERMKDRIGADTVCYRLCGIIPEFFQHLTLLPVKKSINNLIGQAHESVDGVYRRTMCRSQCAYPQRE